MEQQIKRNRSRGFPAVNLEDAIKLARKANLKVGNGPYDRPTIANAWGFKGGSVNRKVAALVHFGLMEISEVGKYRLTQLAEDILHPRSEQEKTTAQMQAALESKLFQEIFDRFQNNNLPEFLSNILIKDFSINAKQADSAAGIFRQTMEFAGYLKGNLLLDPRDNIDLANDEIRQAPPPQNPQRPSDGISTKTDTSFGGAVHTTTDNQQKALQTYRDFQIVLDDLKRSGILQLPEPVEIADFEAVRDWIEYTIKRLKKDSPTNSGD